VVPKINIKILIDNSPPFLMTPFPKETEGELARNGGTCILVTTPKE
jgi:hypothetical protein